MADGKRGRRGRPQPPSERTGEERNYLSDIASSGAALQLKLRDGRDFEATVVDFDVDSIRFEIEGREEVFSKSVIRYLREA